LTGVKATLGYFLIIDWPFVEPELSCVHVIRLCQPPLPSPRWEALVSVPAKSFAAMGL